MARKVKTFWGFEDVQALLCVGRGLGLVGHEETGLYGSLYRPFCGRCLEGKGKRDFF